MLLLLFAGATTAQPTPPTPTHHVGWGFRHKRKELEQRLKRQRDDTFGRRRFEELLAEAAAKADAEKNKAARKALKRAIREAQSVDVETADLGPLMAALEAATGATRTKERLQAARDLLEAAEMQLENDDEEALWLLLN